MPSQAVGLLSVRPFSAEMVLESLEARQLLSTSTLPFNPPHLVDSPVPLAAVTKTSLKAATTISKTATHPHRGAPKSTPVKTPVTTTPVTPPPVTAPPVTTPPVTIPPVTTPPVTTTPVTTTPVTTTPPTTPTTPAAAALEYPLYDSTFTNSPKTAHVVAPGYTQIWWTGAADMENGSGVYDPSQAVITNIANIAKNGGTSPVTHQKISAGTPVFLDFEIDSAESVSFYQQRLDWFHQAAPGVKVGLWGVPLGWSDAVGRDEVASGSPKAIADVDAILQAQAPMINDMDMITLSAYMLGPAYVTRDLDWITVLAGEYHKLFPGKDVVCWMWGAYHYSFNPPNDVLPDGVMQQYIQTAMTSCNALLSWGPDADNAKFKQMSYQMDQTATTAQAAVQAAASVAASTATTSIFSDSSIDTQDADPVLT